MANRVELAVEPLVVDLLAGTPYELVDVEYVKERDYFLRIYIDKEAGIGLDDCQELSRLIEEKLDSMSILTDPYILEVSSPGLDRVLKKQRDFQRELGKDIDITLYRAVDGQKIFTGKLTGYTEDSVIIDDNKEFKLKDTAVIRLHIEF